MATFDLYDLLLHADRSKDLTLVAEDTIRIAPASSRQVALVGSVNQPGIYELLPDEGLDQLLGYAGGFTPLADRTRLAVMDFDDKGQRRLKELAWAPGQPTALQPGTVLRVFSNGAMESGVNAGPKLVHIGGEVHRPGSYVLPPSATIAEALTAAGGLTADAYARGLSLTRPSLAREQAARMKLATNELERSIFENAGAPLGSGSEGAATIAAANAVMRSYIERLRQAQPIGRLVMARANDAAAMPQPTLEDGDTIHVPSTPTTVSVFGAVYGEGSYLAIAQGSLQHYLKAAGGVRPGADVSTIFVLAADGSLKHEPVGFLSRMPQIPVEPGDTIFVPTDLQRGRTWAAIKDLGSMLYQFGLGAAALKTLR